MSSLRLRDLVEAETSAGVPGVVYVVAFKYGCRVGASRDIETARAEVAQAPGSGEIVWTREVPSVTAARWLARGSLFAFQAMQNSGFVASTPVEIVGSIEELATFAGIETA